MWTTLLVDGGLETWDSASVLHNWAYTQGGTGGSLAREATIIKAGTYSAKITKSNATYSRISQVLTSTAQRNLTVTYGAWIKSDNTTASAIIISMNDGTTNTTAPYQNSGYWELISLSAVIGAGTTTITFTMNITTSANNSGIAYFDSAIAICTPIAKINGVRNIEIAKINGVAVSAISKIIGITG
jgi:hypothetical protein